MEDYNIIVNPFVHILIMIGVFIGLNYFFYLGIRFMVWFNWERFD